MQKYQIFVSSTFEDLKLERDQVIKAVLEMGHIPVGMEMFSAADEQQWETIKKQIDQSDYYVVLVARRYGSMDGDVSFTEKEYDYAVSQKLPTLGFILDSVVEWPDKWVENNNDIRKRLENFKAKVSGRMVSFWKTPEDLYGRSGIALMKAFASQPREGWVRASAANTSDMTAEITRLSKENGQLRSQLAAKLQSEVEGKKSKVDEMIDALRRNTRMIYIWNDGAKDWGEPKGTNLLSVFEYMAPDLLDEAGNRTLADSLGLHYSGTTARGNWPVPANFVKAYLADFAGLDLVTNSSKRHSVQDTNSYWTLTPFGRDVHGSIRRNELLRGLAAFEEAPEDDASEA
jgi:hypothetical protein